MLPASLAALSLDVPPLFLGLLALPRPLVLVIITLLPVDMRLRCIEVNRAWRALLIADRTFWRSLDLSIHNVRFSEALFRAAVAKAGGQLLALDLSGQHLPHNFFLLRDVVTANANALVTLTELRLDTTRYWSVEDVHTLLQKLLTRSLFLSKRQP